MIDVVTKDYLNTLNKSFKDEFLSEKIVGEFNYCMTINKFHYNSTENKKVIFFPAESELTKESFNLAINKIKKAGWDVEYKITTCGMGWFNSIIINLK